MSDTEITSISMAIAHFGVAEYYVDTAGKNAKKIQEYIPNQLREGQIHGQMTLKEYTDPFTGSHLYFIPPFA